MIAHLEGNLLAKGLAFIVIQTGGVGYQVQVASSLLASLPALGDRVSIWTKMIVREDDISLFGFESESEREFFEKLMTVSGVGPKVALAALSTFDAPQMAQAVEAGDVTAVATIPGVGKKVAQRIILELKGKLGPVGGDATGAAGVARESGEVTEALLSMGFSSAEVSTALTGFEGDASDTEGAIKYALKRLGANR